MIFLFPTCIYSSSECENILCHTISYTFRTISSHTKLFSRPSAIHKNVEIVMLGLTYCELMSNANSWNLACTNKKEIGILHVIHDNYNC